jgi:adenine phosphoribosyltransferase
MKKLEDYIRSVPDFPEEGIIFRDVTSVLQDKNSLRMAIDQMQEKLDGVDFDLVLGPESRGFIFGVPIAYNLNKAFIPVRKKGKLPCETVEMEYELEYGKAAIEIHKDAIRPGQRVVIIDDLIATGGTIEAITKLVKSLGGEVVKIVFLIELEGLKGRDKLVGFDVESVIQYEDK